MADTTRSAPSIDTLHSGAWGEIHQRIAQRQSLLSVYITLALAVSGTIWITIPTLRPPDAQPSIQSTDLQQASQNLWRVLYVLPLLGVFFVHLVRMHDMQIAVLRSYMAMLAKKGNIDFSFHTETTRGGFVSVTENIRRTNDFACALLVAAFDISAIVAWFFAFNTGHARHFDVIALIISVVISCYSAFLLLTIAKDRRSIGDQIYRKYSDDPLAS